MSLIYGHGTDKSDKGVISEHDLNHANNPGKMDQRNQTISKSKGTKTNTRTFNR
jgi:hypothetical protein